MSYRKILVLLTGETRDRAALDAAFDVGKAFGGHVAALYVKPGPAELLSYLGGDAAGLSAGLVQEVLDAAAESSQAAINAARATLDAAAKAAGAPLRQESAAAGLGYSFQIRQGALEGIVSEEARVSDLAVFEAPAESSDSDLVSAIEAAMFAGGKPVLLAPRGATKIAGAKVAVGWNGSSAAAHAVAFALPLLERAPAIEILNVAAGPIETAEMDRLRDYLRLHGMESVQHSINPGVQPVSTALVGAAERAGAELLVIGGYGHNRLRELVLGGVTRHVFNVVKMPVFLAH